MVVITEPANNTLVSDAKLTIEADADDNVAVTKVVFLYHVDQAGTSSSGAAAAALDPLTMIGSRTAPPYRIQWDVLNTCGAKVSLYAWAYDGCRNVAESRVKIEICR